MISTLIFKGKKLVVALSYFLFFLYITLAAILLFFSPYRQAARANIDSGMVDYNLIPFHTITNYLRASSFINTNILVTNLAGNVVAFMPLGFFLPLLFHRFVKFKFTILVVFVSTLSVECLQYLFRVGSFDVDDLILNTVGGALGFFIFHMIAKILRPIFQVKAKD